MKKIFKSKLLIQVVVASMVATLATAGFVGAATTIGANITTTGTLTVTGNVAVDTNTLTVDAANNKVGIGTTTPFATLSVNNVAGQSAFVIGSSTATWLQVDESGLLTVAKGATFSSTLGVTGAATLASTLASGALTVTGAATISTTLGVTGLTTLVNASTTVLTVSGGTFLNTASSTGIVYFSQIQSTTDNISFDNENLITTGTLGAGATTLSGALAMGINGITTTGNLAFATASSTGQVKVDSLGIASTTPAAGFQLSIGTGTSASSTISMGKFCMYAEQEDGVGVYLRLGSNQAANQPFATSTIPCN